MRIDAPTNFKHNHAVDVKVAVDESTICAFKEAARTIILTGTVAVGALIITKKLLDK